LKAVRESWWLYTRGSVHHYQTYPGMYIPAPLEIRTVKITSSTKTVCREILGLTKMNWNNTQFDNKYPITIGCAARKVGEIMKYLGAKDNPKESYSFYAFYKMEFFGNAFGPGSTLQVRPPSC
jgi:hypothetical protein